MNEPSQALAILSAAPWIVAAQFIAGALIILVARWNKTLSMLLSVGAVAYGFVHSLLIFDVLRQHPELAPWQVNYDWFVSASFKISAGVLIDNLATVMMIVVATVSLFVQIYTHGYMREDPGYSRFYAYLALFTGSMLGLTVSTNLVEMYIFWELVGVCSYFLIGFWWFRNTAAEAALKAFVVNRIGDFGFLVGILLFLGVTYGFWQGHPILAFSDAGGFDLVGAIKWANQQGFLTPALLTTISALVFLGPMAKSAQLPLHVWLSDAMEGPTPISALIHAATMVAAGVYLVARAYPLWLTPEGSMESGGLAVVAWVGTLTAFVAATIALSQFDIKRILAWSTVSQLGYMFAGLGAGAYTGGMFHLFNHAFFKAMLFLCSGAVIHYLHHVMTHDDKLEKKLDQCSLMDRMIPPAQDIRLMGGLRKHIPVTALCFLIGTISISGVPGFSGFFSKDEIISSAFAYQGPGHGLLAWILVLTAGLTAFYMFRVYFLTFEGEYKGTGKPKPEGWKLTVMTAPLAVLAVPSIVSGYLGVNPQAWSELFSQAPGAFQTPFAQFLYFRHVHAEALNWQVMAISTAVSLTGIVLAYMVYMAPARLKLNEWVKQKLKPLYEVSWNKWYFDDVYMIAAQKVLLPVYRSTWSFIDMLLVDNAVNGSARATAMTGERLRYTQNGRGQIYALVIFACVALLGWIIFLIRPYGG